MLITLGFKRVSIAPNGIEALKIIRGHNCDLIISDWNMPQMNGLQLLQAIRESSATAKIPFMMLTANIDPGDVKQAISSGVSEYLLKPFKLNTLKNKVRRAFSSPIPKKSIHEASTTADPHETKNALRSILIVDDEPNNITVLQSY